MKELVISLPYSLVEQLDALAIKSQESISYRSSSKSCSGASGTPNALVGLVYALGAGSGGRRKKYSPLHHAHSDAAVPGRPPSVSFEATGFWEPYPSTSMREASIPIETRAFSVASARAFES